MNLRELVWKNKKTLQKIHSACGHVTRTYGAVGIALRKLKVARLNVKLRRSPQTNIKDSQIFFGSFQCTVFSATFARVETAHCVLETGVKTTCTISQNLELVEHTARRHVRKRKA